MYSKLIKKKYLEFFKNKGHKIIPGSKLSLENDPTTLFTSAGMQPLIPYLKGQPHPQGNRLTNSQPCFRSGDIEEVGDSCHTTFFEMLGNWSLGDYFKKEQLTWVWQFLTKELALEKDKLHISIFKGNEDVAKDEESLEVWKSLGIKNNHIHQYSGQKNWWSISGDPEKMIVGEIGGPDSEVFYDFGQEYKLHENSPFKDEKCHPNCQCGRFLEIGNSVFIQYEKQVDGSFKELSQKNVDFGGGLERLTAASLNNPDIFKSDLLWPLIEIIIEATGASYENPGHKTAMQIIADHLKASTFLIIDGITPSNKLQGYILRRLLRRSAVKLRAVTGEIKSLDVFDSLIDQVFILYTELKNPQKVKQIIKEEIDKFSKTLEKGLKEVEKIDPVILSEAKDLGKKAFYLYQTYGLPLEITQELLEIKGLKIDRQQFQEQFKKHQDLSRSSSGVFKGGLVSQGQQETKYHSATHLLHQALRTILGDHVIQRGSNITTERLRFDFSHPEKLTPDQIKKVENLVNEQIQKDLSVSFYETTPKQALKDGAIGAFGERYGEKVKVYIIGEPVILSEAKNIYPSAKPQDDKTIFSREICGGPHVEGTGTLGHFKIIKEESAGSGIRRIYATLG